MTCKAWRAVLPVIVLGFVLLLRPAAAETVDLQLVLAADVSRSVDDGEFQLQRQGYATAFQDPRVMRAIRSGQYGRIAVCYVEWSGPESLAVIADWTVVGDDESAGAFAEAILAPQRPFANRTAIGAAIDFARMQFIRSGVDSLRRTIDVSGDGTNNAGRDVTLARDDALKLGININGLVILSEHPLPWNPEHTNPPGGLAKYYQDHVTGGPGSFVMEAKDFNSFGDAIIKKMIAEIAQATPPGRQAALPPR